MARKFGSKNKPKDGKALSLAAGKPRNEVKANIAQNFNDTLIRAKLSIPILAASSGITPPTLYAIKEGKQVPNRSNRWKLCTALVCSIEWLWADHSGLTQDEAFALEGAPDIAFLDSEGLRRNAAKIEKRIKENLRISLHQSPDDKVRLAAFIQELNRLATSSEGATPEGAEKARVLMGESNFLISKILKDENLGGIPKEEDNNNIPTQEEAKTDRQTNLGKRLNMLLGLINQKTPYLCRTGMSSGWAYNVKNGVIWPSENGFKHLATLFAPLTVAQLKGEELISMEEMQNLKPMTTINFSKVDWK